MAAHASAIAEGPGAGGILRDVSSARFRAGGAFDLVLYDRLPATRRADLAEVAQRQSIYGVLVDKDDPNRFKVVCRETALLWLTMQTPGRLPAYLDTTLGSAKSRTVADMVLNGILEIDAGDMFLSGPAAHGQLFEGKPPTIGEGPLAALSLEALRYAQSLPIEDPARLALKLYQYNTAPAPRAWKQDLATEEGVAHLLGLEGTSGVASLLRERWQMPPGQGIGTGWRSWALRGDAQPGALAFKLYVSPAPEGVAQAFAACVDMFTELRAPAFKVGRDLNGLLRADKLVSYYRTRKHLLQVATALTTRLAGAPVQGVPFTAACDGRGMLSWGMDPGGQLGAAMQGMSWRQWISHGLALAICNAKRTGIRDREPWEYALDRLRLDNIDVLTWTPIGGGT